MRENAAEILLLRNSRENSYVNIFFKWEGFFPSAVLESKMS